MTGRYLLDLRFRMVLPANFDDEDIVTFVLDNVHHIVAA